MRSGPRKSPRIRSNCAFIRGADGDFTLYEDENDNYNYEKGAYATIPLHWNDAAAHLTIGDRKGEFPGMLREAHVPRGVRSREPRGRRQGAKNEADKIVQYSGKQITRPTLSKLKHFRLDFRTLLAAIWRLATCRQET